MVTLIDVCVSSRPWKFGHVYVVQIYGGAYGIFQLIYILGFDGTDASGNDWVYPIMKWKTDPGEAVMWVAIVLAVSIMGHGLLCLLAYGQDVLWKNIFCKDRSITKDSQEAKVYNTVTDNKY